MTQYENHVKMNSSKVQPLTALATLRVLYAAHATLKSQQCIKETCISTLNMPLGLVHVIPTFVQSY